MSDLNEQALDAAVEVAGPITAGMVRQARLDSDRDLAEGETYADLEAASLNRQLLAALPPTVPPDTRCNEKHPFGGCDCTPAVPPSNPPVTLESSPSREAVEKAIEEHATAFTSALDHQGQSTYLNQLEASRLAALLALIFPTTTPETP